MGEKVFISYARTDGEFALRLAQDLRAADVDVWLDQLKLVPLTRGIRRSTKRWKGALFSAGYPPRVAPGTQRTDRPW